VALIKGIKISSSLLLAAIFLSPAFASDDELLLEELRQSLEKNVSSEMGPMFRAELKDTGLASSDIERLVEDLEDEVVACFLESLVEHSKNQDVPLSDLVHKFNGEMGISPVGSDFEILLNNCLNTARLEAGISGLELD
jgi:hypothetical protein